MVQRWRAEGRLLVFQDACARLGSKVYLWDARCIRVYFAEILWRASVFQIAHSHTHVLGNPRLCPPLIVKVRELVSLAVIGDLGCPDGLASSVAAHLSWLERSSPRRIEHPVVFGHVLALIQIHVIIGINGLILEIIFGNR